MRGPMCLAIPGRVLRIDGEEPLERTALVDFDGTFRTVRLAYLPEARPGDYVLVQAGFALRRVPDEEARAAWELARAPLDGASA